MKNLLIGYDGSACSDAMLEELSSAGLPAELDVKVVSVADVWLPPDPEKLEPAFPDPAPQLVRKARDQAIAELESSRGLAQRACERLKAAFPKWKVYPTGIADSPAWGLVKEAEASRADLIALGSHGRSAVGRFFLGSVAQKVAAEAHCSIHISRPRHEHVGIPLRIIVAVDGLSGSQTALEAVTLRTWPRSAQFRVVTVIDSRVQTAVAWFAGYQGRWLQPYDIAAQDWVCRMAEDSAVRLSKAGLAAETHIFDGDAKAIILREAERWESDCIFLGGRGLEHGERLVLGTTALAVAARAHCSVEIVRPA